MQPGRKPTFSALVHRLAFPTGVNGGLQRGPYALKEERKSLGGKHTHKKGNNEDPDWKCAGLEPTITGGAGSSLDRGPSQREILIDSPSGAPTTTDGEIRTKEMKKGRRKKRFW